MQQFAVLLGECVWWRWGWGTLNKRHDQVLYLMSARRHPLTLQHDWEKEWRHNNVRWYLLAPTGCTSWNIFRCPSVWNSRLRAQVLQQNTRHQSLGTKRTRIFEHPNSNPVANWAGGPHTNHTVITLVRLMPFTLPHTAVCTRARQLQCVPTDLTNTWWCYTKNSWDFCTALWNGVQ